MAFPGSQAPTHCGFSRLITTRHGLPKSHPPSEARHQFRDRRVKRGGRQFQIARMRRWQLARLLDASSALRWLWGRLCANRRHEYPPGFPLCAGVLAQHAAHRAAVSVTDPVRLLALDWWNAFCLGNGAYTVSRSSDCNSPIACQENHHAPAGLDLPRITPVNPAELDSSP
jgi:hypothetical protein